ncbi:MAG: hypothetical protein DHS20C16_20280 [Phycisphaerae bacterium]|nr:MAG: hypothetical protein DHS20C16_20280 [Phycisphaerae bacterium]
MPSEHHDSSESIWRRASRKERASILEAELRDLLCEWDPYGLLDIGCSTDDFDSMLSPILKLLDRGISRPVLASQLETYFKNHFGSGPTTPQFEAAANAIYDWYSAKEIL